MVVVDATQSSMSSDSVTSDCVGLAGNTSSSDFNMLVGLRGKQHQKLCATFQDSAVPECFFFSFSRLAFPRRQPCYFWLVQVSDVYCYSIEITLLC